MTTFRKLRHKLAYAIAYDATFRALAPISGRRLTSCDSRGIDALGAADAAGHLAAAGVSHR